MSNEKGVSQRKMIYWILGALFALFVLIILYSCCWVSGMADRQSEEHYRTGKIQQEKIQS